MKILPVGIKNSVRWGLPLFRIYKARCGWFICACSALGLRVPSMIRPRPRFYLKPFHQNFSRAATWNSSVWQFGSITGPAIGGVIVAIWNRVDVIYVFDAIAALTFAMLVSQIKGRVLPLARKSATLDLLKEGIRFMRETKVILAAITLDMFAVLSAARWRFFRFTPQTSCMSGAGLGNYAGGTVHRSHHHGVRTGASAPDEKRRWTLLLAVTGFGIATIAFGLSTTFWLSVSMLVLLGALDNISVVIRATLMLTYAPNEMRGGVSSVNNIFIATSNERNKIKQRTKIKDF